MIGRSARAELTGEKRESPDFSDGPESRNPFALLYTDNDGTNARNLISSSDAILSSLFCTGIILQRIDCTTSSSPKLDARHVQRPDVVRFCVESRNLCTDSNRNV